MLSLHRLVVRTLGPSVYRSSFTTTTFLNAVNPKSKNSDKEVAEKSEPKQKRSQLTSAAFDNLQSKDNETLDKNRSNSKSDDIDERIANAKTVMGLLSVSEGSAGLTRKHALKIVSILAEWSSANRTRLSEFENDARFIKLCRQLGRTVKPNAASITDANNKTAPVRTEDLNTVMRVAGDDEAAKLIANMNASQMIRVMSSMAIKKRRSTPLLRALSYNIGINTEFLNLKECADLLYAMAVLNFPDAGLITRVTMDIHCGLDVNVDKPAAVGSIITSLGLLKFRNSDLLESLTSWMVKHHDICRTQDISSLFLTLATLNYPTLKTNELKSIFVSKLGADDFQKSSEWLNYVWALVVLDFAEAQHYKSVLRKEFIEELVLDTKGNLLPTMKMKLLNINAATKCLGPKYDGPTLAQNSEIFSIPMEHSKNKIVLVDGLKDTLKNLFSAENLVRTNGNTRMGFVIDAECVFDNKGNPLPVEGDHKNSTRVAIMVRDYHDLCQGVFNQPNGISALTQKLLEQAGYNVLVVPHTEFNTSDKLIKRVQYLEEKLKEITAKKNQK